MIANDKRVLLTGADGLLGSNLCRILLKRGYKIRAFLLEGVRAKTLDDLAIEKIYGNLLNKDSVIRAAADCDIIIHAAANTNMWPERCETIRKVNIEGTRNVLAAYKANNIKRLIHVSSASSFHFGTKDSPGTEETHYSGGMYRLDYIDSKYQAQLEVQKAVAAEGVQAIIINPTFMFGPFDSKPSSGKMILGIYSKKVPGYAVGGKNFVDARDVATAMANAISMGRIGECYIAGHQNLSYRELFEIIGKAVGVTPPKMKMAPGIMKLYGRLSNFGGKLFKVTPAISYALARISCDGQYFSPAKAVKELKMPQTPLETSITDAFNWLLENGYAKDAKPVKSSSTV